MRPKHYRSDIRDYKTDLYYDAVADKLETLLLDYDFALAGDRELADALTLRGVPVGPVVLGIIRRERGLPNKWQRMRQHLGQAQEWAESQQERQ